MKKKMNRHEGVADWELELGPDEKLNAIQRFSQRVAAKTNGVVTPGNALSAVGAGLVGWGLYDYMNGRQGLGVAKILAGKTFDYFDGKVANWTKTKSPLGEAVDAGFDTATIAGMLGVAAITETVPIPALIAITARNVGTIALTAIDKMRGWAPHSSKEQKINQPIQWLTLGVFAVAGALKPGPTQDTLNAVGYAGTVVTVPYGAWGTIKGHREAKAIYKAQQLQEAA